MSWDDSEKHLSERSSLLILAEDGAVAQAIPLAEPEVREVKGTYGKREVYAVPFYVLPANLDPDAGEVLEREMGVKEFRSYKTVARGKEIKAILEVTRIGVPGDQKTRYTWTEKGSAGRDFVKAAKSAWTEAQAERD
jgi:hypothetical protein